MDVGDSMSENSLFWIDSYGILRNNNPDVMTKDENDILNVNQDNAHIDDEILYLNDNAVFTESIIGRRMYDYWPLVVKIITDLKSIITAEFPEFEVAWESKEDVLENAFLASMGEARIKQWEDILHLNRTLSDSVDMRRAIVIARLQRHGKLNTASINKLVETFTGGTAESYVRDSTLYVWITPPENSREYRFSAIEEELNRRKPAHLGLNVSRVNQTWGEVKTKCSTWQVEANMYSTWNDTVYDIENN